MRNQKEAYKGRPQAIFRAEKDEINTYTIVSHYITRDKRLTAIEKGLALAILDKPDDWDIVKSVFFREFGAGRVYFDKSWKRLEDLGYIESSRIQGGYKYRFFEKPMDIGSLTNDAGVSCADVI